ncbi:MAG: hypothetical protein ABFS30_09595 [Pseudomonadota bacterium]
MNCNVHGVECEVVFDHYENGNVALSLIDKERREPYGRASVNIRNVVLPPDQVLIKTWSENQGMLEALVTAGIVEPTARTIPVEFSDATVCRLLCSAEEPANDPVPARWYVVEGSFPYRRRFQVGVQADDAPAAEALATAAMDAGTFYADTDTMPLLMDRFEEDGSAGEVLELAAIASHAEMPAPDALSVLEDRRHAAAMACAWALFSAYQQGEKTGGSVEWSDIDTAYELARQAIGDIPVPRLSDTGSCAAQPSLSPVAVFIDMTGGGVHEISSDVPGLEVVIYDTDTGEEVDAPCRVAYRDTDGPRSAWAKVYTPSTPSDESQAIHAVLKRQANQEGA